MASALARAGSRVLYCEALRRTVFEDLVPVTLELPLLMIVFFSLAIGAVLLPGLVLLSTALRLFRIRPTQLDTRGTMRITIDKQCKCLFTL
jgi:hypothetical protein